MSSTKFVAVLAVLASIALFTNAAIPFSMSVSGTVPPTQITPWIGSFTVSGSSTTFNGIKMRGITNSYNVSWVNRIYFKMRNTATRAIHVQTEDIQYSTYVTQSSFFAKYFPAGYLGTLSAPDYWVRSNDYRWTRNTCTINIFGLIIGCASGWDQDDLNNFVGTSASDVVDTSIQVYNFSGPDSQSKVWAIVKVNSSALAPAEGSTVVLTSPGGTDYTFDLDEFTPSGGYLRFGGRARVPVTGVFTLKWLNLMNPTTGGVQQWAGSNFASNVKTTFNFTVGYPTPAAAAFAASTIGDFVITDQVSAATSWKLKGNLTVSTAWTSNWTPGFRTFLIWCDNGVNGLTLTATGVPQASTPTIWNFESEAMRNYTGGSYTCGSGFFESGWRKWSYGNIGAVKAAGFPLGETPSFIGNVFPGSVFFSGASSAYSVVAVFAVTLFAVLAMLF